MFGVSDSGPVGGGDDVCAAALPHHGLLGDRARPTLPWISTASDHVVMLLETFKQQVVDGSVVVIGVFPQSLKIKECCVRLQFCTVKLYWAREGGGGITWTNEMQFL